MCPAMDDRDADTVNVYGYNESVSHLTIIATVASSASNVTTQQPHGPPDPIYPGGTQAIIAVVFSLLILGTVLGNTLVCLAVGLAKRLQSPSNLLIVSLAVSDLLVAALVMPLAAVYEILGYWPFSIIVCDIWTSLDVIMCTASILNLCMISIDRYFFITKPFEYASKRTPKRMALMIMAVWCLSVIISVPPLFGWRATRQPYHCTISQEIGYQIYATLGAFYLPLFVMIMIYFKIWRISSSLLKKHRYRFGSVDAAMNSSCRSSGQSETSIYRNGSIRNGINNNESHIDLPLKRTLSKRRFTLLPSFSSRSTNRSKRPSGPSDRRATKTLGIIMGGFTMCWLPFFILAVLRPFLAQDAIPQSLSSCLMWLGYFNSFLNPVIYARFNTEFRTPFKLILCCQCHGLNRRLRSQSYVERYGPDRIYRDKERDSFRIQNSAALLNHRDRTTCMPIHLENGFTNNIRETIL